MIPLDPLTELASIGLSRQSKLIKILQYDHSDALSVGSPLDKPEQVIPFPTLGDIADAQ